MDNQNWIYMDGTYNDIVYGIETELNGFLEMDTNLKKDTNGIEAYAKAIAELLIRANETSNDEEQFSLGFQIPTNKRYYLKVDLSLIKAIADFAFAIIMLFGTSSQSGILIASASLQAMSGAIGIKKALLEVPKEHFCVMLAAHQKKENQLVSLEDIITCISSGYCPFSPLYRTTYDQFCQLEMQNHKCKLNRDNIIQSLRELGTKYGISEIAKDKLFRVN